MNTSELGASEFEWGKTYGLRLIGPFSGLSGPGLAAYELPIGWVI